MNMRIEQTLQKKNVEIFVELQIDILAEVVEKTCRH